MKSFIDPSYAKLLKIVRTELEPGNTILHYTGSMYGIGCRVSDTETIKRIFNLKKRSQQKGLIVLIPDVNWLADNDIFVPERLKPILEQYWPGNLTIVFDTDHPLLEEAAFEGKVAFRVPADDMLRAMIEEIGEPLISTSINVSTLPPEEDFNRIKKNYGDWFDLAVIPNPKHLSPQAEPSTVVEYIQASDHKDSKASLKCIREGSIPFYGIKKSFEMPMVMFVCTANICRSPIADYLFNHYMKQESMRYVGDSSGLLESGHMISVNSLQLLLQNGITEAQLHISQQITPQLISDSWIILTMEERQRDFLRNNHSNSRNKIFTLNEIVGEKGDVEDPYGSDLDSYRKTYEIIDDRLKRLITLIKENKIYKDS